MRITEKVISNYMENKSVDKTLGCHMVACDSFGKNCSKVVIGSSGKLDKNTVRRFIFSCTDHKLIPYTESIQYFQDREGTHNYASVIAYKPSIHYKDTKKAGNMTQINSNSFLDEELGNVWEKKEYNGKQYFVRSNDDNVEEILEEAYLNSSNAQIRASANINDFTPRMAAGDYVEFFTFKDDTPGKAVGYVTSAKEDTVFVKVSSKTNKEFEIPVHAIVTRIPGDEVATPEDVVDWLKDALTSDENAEYKRQLENMKDKL